MNVHGCGADGEPFAGFAPLIGADRVRVTARRTGAVEAVEDGGDEDDGG
ncbi:hypothetical protein [Streptosporangium sp. NPDC051022]